MAGKTPRLRRREINARLDQLREMEPSPEVTEEYCALCRALQCLPRPSAFRQICSNFRGIIWFESVLLCLAALLSGPMLLRSCTSQGAAALLFLVAPANAAWAVWSSRLPG